MVVTESGIFTTTRELQPLNAYWPIDVRVEGNTRDSREIHPSNACLPKLVTESLKVTDVRLTQELNARLLTAVMESGIVNEVKDTQPLNISLCIYGYDPSTAKEDNALQSRNTPVPTDSIEDPDIEVSVSLYANAPDSNEVTVSGME